MLIGIDCGCLGLKNDKNRGGIYSLTKALLKSLSKIDKKNNYLLYSFYPIDKKLMKELGSHMENIVVSPSKGWMSFFIPIQIHKDKPDLFIGISQALPKRLPFLYYPKTISFFYDLGFEKYPQMYLGFPKKLKRNSKSAAMRADLIIASSNNTKKDLLNIYGVSSTKIKVVYPAIDSKVFIKSGKFKNINPYFLFVGAFKPTKNLQNIIKAFIEFSQIYSKKFDLILVGGDSEEIREISKDNSKLGIKIMGFVKDQELQKIYKGAFTFVSPSFYEGFGMTLLEAMRFGLPIITSKKGSIPEVVSKNSIFVNPNNYKEIAKQMISLSENNILRRKISKEEIKKSKEFSPNKFGYEVLKIINSL